MWGVGGVWVGVSVESEGVWLYGLQSMSVCGVRTGGGRYEGTVGGCPLRVPHTQSAIFTNCSNSPLDLSCLSVLARHEVGKDLLNPLWSEGSLQTGKQRGVPCHHTCRQPQQANNNKNATATCLSTTTLAPQ